MILFIYLVAKLADTLKILDTEPSVGGFTFGSMCSSTMSASLTVDVPNPSGTSATLLPMSSSVFFKPLPAYTPAPVYNATTNTTTYAEEWMFLGTAASPSLPVVPGANLVTIPLDVSIPLESSKAVQLAIKQYLEGFNLTLLVRLPLVVSFGSEVFLVPIEFAYEYDFEFTIDALGNSTEYEPEYEEESSYITDVELLVPRTDVNSYVKADIALSLWNDSVAGGYEFLIPPLNFELQVDGVPTAVGRSQTINYGNVELEQKIWAEGAIGNEHVEGVHLVLDKFFNTPAGMETSLPLRLVVMGDTMNHPEYDEYRVSNGSGSSSGGGGGGGNSCYLHQLLQGLEVDINTTYVAPTPSPTATLSAQVDSTS